MEEINEFVDIMKSMFTSEDGSFEFGLFIKMAIGFVILGFLYLKFKKATKVRNKGVQKPQNEPNYDEMTQTKEEKAKSINGSDEVDKAVVRSLKNGMFDSDYKNLKTSLGYNAETLYEFFSKFLSESDNIYNRLNKELEEHEIPKITGTITVKQSGFLVTYAKGDVITVCGFYNFTLSMSDLLGCSVDDLIEAISGNILSSNAF